MFPVRIDAIIDMNVPRRRPLSLGSLRAFEAVARRLSFRGAADELHLTQPAISRQIRALEDELGTALFLRGTRHVELTGPGSSLLRSGGRRCSSSSTARVRQIRSVRNRRQVGVTTFASFASLWLLPRLPYFQREHPDIDIRISAQRRLGRPGRPGNRCRPALLPPEGRTAEFTAAVRRSGHARGQPGTGCRRGAAASGRSGAAHAARGRRPPPQRRVPGLAALADAARQPTLEPRRWVFLNFTYQQIQAALAGQGVALARLALVGDTLARGDLIEPFGLPGRIASPFGYWLVRWPARRDRPELQAFENWLLAQAEQTRATLEGAPEAPRMPRPGAKIPHAHTAEALDS